MTYDVIVRNGLWFDGTGASPQTRTLGIRDGIVAAVSAEPLDETGCPDVIDAEGKWVVPGFIDVHTHYDAEVLLDPGLRESVRHGVTTVLLGNCSLSTVYADSEDAADLLAASKRCRASTCSAPCKPRRRGRRPPNTFGHSTIFHSGRMWVPCLAIRTCEPQCSDSTAPPPTMFGRRTRNWSG
jgi:Amidohydrolase family